MRYIVNGTGKYFRGETDHLPNGSFATTLWFNFMWQPLFPLRSCRIVYLAPRDPKVSEIDIPPGTPMAVQTNYFNEPTNCIELEALPLNWAQVGWTYLAAILHIAAFIGGTLLIMSTMNSGLDFLWGMAAFTGLVYLPRAFRYWARLARAKRWGEQ